MERIFKIRCSQIGKIMGNAKKAGELSQTCKTYLETWYANDNEPIFSKYTEKGEQVENELIEFAIEKLGFGIGEKNMISLEDEYFTGTCDVDLEDCIIDTKAPWNNKTLLDQAVEPIDSDYEWQGRGYMRLYKKPRFILFYGLLPTPEHLSPTKEEITFDHIPEDERWFAYKIEHDQELIETVIERVKMCREYLIEYDKLVKSKLGRIN